MKRHMLGLASIVVMIATAQSSFAFGFKKKCCDECAPPCADSCAAYTEVAKTIMVPQMVLENRKVMVRECRPEVRERKVNVCKMVATTEQRTREICVMVPEVRVRQEKVLVCKPVWSEETRECTVMVSRMEKRQGTRTVCKPVQVVEKRKVCHDQGHWEDRCEVVCCKTKVDCCGNCVSVPVTRSRKVWVPNMVEKEIDVTVCKMQQVQENYEYCVRVCVPEKRTNTVKVCKMVQEEQVRECKYTVCVPTKKVETVNVTVCKPVHEERIEKYTVMVPHCVEKEIQVKVCRMVPKTIMCKVPCAPAPACAPAPCCN